MRVPWKLSPEKFTTFSSTKLSWPSWNLRCDKHLTMPTQILELMKISGTVPPGFVQLSKISYIQNKCRYFFPKMFFQLFWFLFSIVDQIIEKAWLSTLYVRNILSEPAQEFTVHCAGLAAVHDTLILQNHLSENAISIVFCNKKRC